MFRRLACALALAVVTLPALASSTHAKPTPAVSLPLPAERIPPLVLWAWEQPQDLRAIDPARVGVAYLARTIELGGDRVSVRPRFQPLRVPAGTRLVAVGRIETRRDAPPELDLAQRRRAVLELASLAHRPGVIAVQVDFDATHSQRPFYRDLLAELRAALPDTVALSMTALASWCLGDPWLADLPVDEAVPMVFRMGADQHRIRADLAAGKGFSCRLCRGSVGIATDEPAPRIAGIQRRYVFHPGRWTEAAMQLQQALARNPR
ncbi:MAG TPA: DUF3142 domain-containing protein [Candidatus Limnocylindria bacterium]|nr:DUF3142 domain-containing protein [Candidatus Limnocylindria bacterium]